MTAADLGKVTNYSLAKFENIMKLLSITLAILLPLAACGQVKDKGNDGQKEKSATVRLTTDEFKAKVYDYTANPDEFKYSGTMPAIVDFYATWCRPCRMLAPTLDELAKEYAGKIIVYKVDVDECKDLAAAFGIRSIPTLLFIPMEGQPSMSAGAPSKENLKQIIEKMTE